MPTLRFPVLLVENHRGFCTAFRVDGEEQAAADSPQEALQQLKDLLAWKHQEDPEDVQPNIHKPALFTVEVGVRPEIQDNRRSFPSDDLVPLRIHAVRGVRESGLQLCYIPQLSTRFYFHADDNLPTLVQHAVQNQLGGEAPSVLHRHLPARSVSLEDITLKVPVARNRLHPKLSLPTLERIADPLDGSGRRKQSTSAAFEREQEVATLMRRLSEPASSHLIVGESGSGKSTVLQEAIRRLKRGPRDTPPELETDVNPQAARFWRTSGARILSGMAYLGQWQERCDALIQELSEVDGLLCIEDVLELLRSGGAQASEGVAAYLVPYLRAGQLRLVAEVTPSGLDACRRLLPSLVEQCQLLTLEPMNRQQATLALRKAAESLQHNRKIQVEDDAVQTLIGLYRRFLPYRALPGAAMDFLRRQIEAFAKEPRSPGEGAALPILSRDQVVTRFVLETGLPETLVRDELPLTHASVYEALRAKVIAQDSACDALAGLVATFKAALTDPGRPIGVYLLSGPTGVGKTELARTLSTFLFGHGEGLKEGADRLIRLDMSEYSGPGAAQRLLTGPDGEPSPLLQRVRQQPFVVLLLDEIEKAAPEVFDLLLGVLDEGRLTDRFGRTTYFRSAIILLTSNLGARRQEAPGFGARPPAGSEAEVMAFFRPEFFNRLDGVLTFQPLELPSIRRIVQLELGQIVAREGLVRRHIRLRWTDRLELYLARTGYHLQYGARPLQRTLEAKVVSPLAQYLLAHPTLSDITLELDLDDAERVTFMKVSE